jgi:hypothetical protein
MATRTVPDNDTSGHGPIFIGGLGRSGKTYTRLMLAAHPGLAFSKRTQMWTRFYDQYGDLAQANNFERCLNAMLRHKHIRSLEPDAGRIRREFSQGSPTYARLFALIHEHHAERQQKRRWGDQSEGIERFAGLIIAAYPNARMIYMARDPRDRYEAMLTQRPQTKGKVGAATAQWLHSVSLAWRNQQKYPGQFQIVRYESLVLQPEETLDGICRFLGEAYLPSLVAMEDAPRFRRADEARRRPGVSPLSADFIGRYRTGLSPYEIAFIQQYAARYMQLYGYALEPIRSERGRSVRFHPLHWLTDTAHLLGWRVLSMSGNLVGSRQ